MSRLMQRAGIGAMVWFLAAAVVGVSTAAAAAAEDLDGDLVSTTCGAGTEAECAQKPIMHCDFVLKFGINPLTKEFEFEFGKTNCHSVGEVPIYKNMKLNESVLSGSCNLLNPFLGLPSGSGCS